MQNSKNRDSSVKKTPLLVPVPDAKNLPTQVGYDDGLQSGGDPQCGWRACRWASLRCFLTVCAEIGTSGTPVEQLICDTGSAPTAPTPDQTSRFDTLMLRSRRMAQLWALFNLMEEREGQLQISTGSNIVELRVEIQHMGAAAGKKKEEANEQQVFTQLREEAMPERQACRRRK